ncbi:putative TIM-barrel fold metal-dependent hydrolase [Homoserinimonas aerilata]|uniref:Putative TIM-barrel fold metal-dependent hydrolase n=1 Tax=Homoserinimonas aerilata TaxID=1162970 RepID=A0A542YFW4_9MICO|nr:amidohydrolase family protein [Homoserinimonas aerilata]TQL46968.1 putative TIM-barrel fold metal-dependent hydrolase [Homoserinimonas aerilata]
MPETDAAAAGYDGPVIDAHHHVWDLRRNLHPWLTPEGKVAHRYGDYSAIKHDYLAADFLDDIEGTPVEASVYMEAEWDPSDPLGEVEYIREISATTGVPGAMAAQAWLNAPDLAEVLSSYAATGIVRSVRHKPGGPATLAAVGSERTLMSDDAWRAGYALLEEHGMHFELQTPWWNLPEAVELAKDFPATTLVINHSGVLLDREPETLAGWRAAIDAAAALPNVVIKASGLCVEGVPWSVDLNARVVLDMVAAFGAERVMFGSNFPVDGMFTTYRGLLDGYREITSVLSASEQRAFFHDTAARVYRPTPIVGDSVL